MSTPNVTTSPKVSDLKPTPQTEKSVTPETKVTSPAPRFNDGETVTIAGDTTKLTQKFVIPGIGTHLPIREILTPDGLRKVICLSGSEIRNPDHKTLTDKVRAPEDITYFWGEYTHIDIGINSLLKPDGDTSFNFAVVKQIFYYVSNQYLIKLICKLPITTTANMYIAHSPDTIVLTTDQIRQLPGFSWDLKAIEEIYVLLPFVNEFDVVRTTNNHYNGSLHFSPLHAPIGQTTDPTPQFLEVMGVPFNTTFYARNAVSNINVVQQSASTELCNALINANLPSPLEEHSPIDPDIIMFKILLHSQESIVVTEFDAPSSVLTVEDLSTETKLLLWTIAQRRTHLCVTNESSGFERWGNPQEKTRYQLIIRNTSSKDKVISGHITFQSTPGTSPRLHSKYFEFPRSFEPHHLLPVMLPKARKFTYAQRDRLITAKPLRIESMRIERLDEAQINKTKFPLTSFPVDDKVNFRLAITPGALPKQLSLPMTRFQFTIGTPQLHMKIQATPFHNVKVAVMFCVRDNILRAEKYHQLHVIVDSKDAEVVIKVPWLARALRLGVADEYCHMVIFPISVNVAPQMLPAQFLLFASRGSMEFLNPVPFTKSLINFKINRRPPTIEPLTKQSSGPAALPYIRVPTTNLPSVGLITEGGNWIILTSVTVPLTGTPVEVSLQTATYPDHAAFEIDRHHFISSYPAIKVQLFTPATTDASVIVAFVPSTHTTPLEAYPHATLSARDTTGFIPPVWYHTSERQPVFDLNSLLVIKVINNNQSAVVPTDAVKVTVWIDTSTCRLSGVKNHLLYD